MPFFQDPPSVPHPFRTDRLLRGYLERVLPEEIREAVEPGFDELGTIAAGPLLEELARGRDDEPKLVSWDPWGHRVDRIELTPLWQTAQRLAAESRQRLASRLEGLNKYFGTRDGLRWAVIEEAGRTKDAQIIASALDFGYSADDLKGVASQNLLRDAAKLRAAA